MNKLLAPIRLRLIRILQLPSLEQIASLIMRLLTLLQSKLFTRKIQSFTLEEYKKIYHITSQQIVKISNLTKTTCLNFPSSTLPLLIDET